ncbi:MAG: nucleotidyltransferase domain-containing protein [Oscillospiraceae bacterium]|jgi:predicted nucleotidyltransferase|nr:nucleotidyltransferase domain-containing protein [Oscillospiraceae bacterium]
MATAREIPQEIRDMTRLIAGAVPCEAIYLFGSFAYGTPHAHSDYDLFLALPEGGLSVRRALFEARYALRGFDYSRDLDLLAAPARQLAESKGLRGCVESEILEKGVLLYAARRPDARVA